MPHDVTTTDIAAFALFLVLWAGYNVVMDGFSHRIPSINRHMRSIRLHWMERFLERDNRIVDSQLLGFTISSVTFFASTSILVIAGLIGVFGAIGAAHHVVTGLRFTVGTSLEFFELKLALIVGIFAFGFFKFTWALRQYNYACALLGSAPLCPVDPALKGEMAAVLADAVSSAIGAFNGGLRSYYFALAALMWFVQPWLFAAASAGVVGLLLHRQLGSRFFQAVRRHGMLLESGGPGPRP